MTHLAYNIITGEVLTTNQGNQLKRWVVRHSINDNKWAKANGYPPIGHRWIFAHGKDHNECIAKLTIRGTWG